MGVKYLEIELTEIQDEFTDESGNTYRINRVAKKKLTQLRLAKINENKEVNVKYDQKCNNIDITVSGYTYDATLEDTRAILNAVDLFTIDASIDGKVNFSMSIRNAYKRTT